MNPKFIRQNNFEQDARATSSHREQDARATSSHREQDARATPSLDWRSLSIKKGFYLPHWTCEGAIYHVTLRLADSLPTPVLEAWVREREAIVSHAKSLGRPLIENEERRLRQLYSAKVEAYLDAGHGACHLKQESMALMVISALQFFCGQRYLLHAWCVMPNHVHVIVQPLIDWPLNKILHSWTSFTANKANQILGRSGQFWQHEPYDHIIRNAREYEAQLRYVWENPDAAGLKNWPWRWSVELPAGDNEHE